LLRVKIPSDVNSVSLPAGLTGSVGGCLTAPTGSVAIAIQQNGVGIGSVNIAAGAITATFTFSAAVTLNPGDLLDFIAPTTPDLTLAGLYFSIAGVRN
jgi:hypothetical protein